MTTTYQRNALDISYNGWENYETWNVALWINNDEGLYNIASEAGSYEDFVDYVRDFMVETPDGVRFDDPKVNVIQLNSDVFDFQELVSDSGIAKCTSHKAATGSTKYLSQHTLTHTLMRYIPSSHYTFDEIVQQCYDAINRIPTMSTPNDDSFYNELLQFEEYRELIAA